MLSTHRTTQQVFIVPARGRQPALEALAAVGSQISMARWSSCCNSQQSMSRELGCGLRVCGLLAWLDCTGLAANHHNYEETAKPAATVNQSVSQSVGQSVSRLSTCSSQINSALQASVPRLKSPMAIGSLPARGTPNSAHPYTTRSLFRELLSKPPEVLLLATI